MMGIFIFVLAKYLKKIAMLIPKRALFIINGCKYWKLDVGRRRSLCGFWVNAEGMSYVGAVRAI